MTRCRICSAGIPESSSVCSSCGALFVAEADGPTLTLDSGITAAQGSHRFAAGTLLAGRYRTIEPLGSGGMGEVYKAVDLKLGQVVALKFLPNMLRTNARALARLHNEVRVARQVSHPNVCRVHDIVETDGLHFLTMEFIDGEDFAHLLKRIGRLPRDKGVEVARKLCGALSAAHDRGVLHRDLKPANIMLNSTGQVLVTDFGLAAMAEQLKGADIASGTPAYMAPEQLEGREVTTRSDIYSLGLVLYEIFTGRRAFESGQRSDLPNPSSLVTDLDPAIERVILSCLAEKPEDRPAAAFVIARALPGGDPLEAALAAGETPSPEMVAAAGEEAGGSVRSAVMCFAGVLAFLLGFLSLADRVQLIGRIPHELPPQALSAKAREIAASLGYKTPPRDQAFGFGYDTRLASQLTQGTSAVANQLDGQRAAAVQFWYRESPSPLVPWGVGGVKPYDPAPILPGMIGLRLDSAGRLIQFYAIAPAQQAEAHRRPIDWTSLLSSAGLDSHRLEPATTERVPPVACDARSAWQGSYPDYPESRVRVEAASLAGRPVYFRVFPRWAITGDQTDEPLAATIFIRPDSVSTPGGQGYTLALAMGLIACWLAWRNLRNGRGDRQGAFRFAACAFALQLICRVLAGDLDEAFREVHRARVTLGFSLFYGFYGWVAYMALEPLIRRKWPHSLVSWSRLLAGRLRDPLAGRDILVGVLAACLFALVVAGGFLAKAEVFGSALPPGAGRILGVLLAGATDAAMAALMLAFLFVLFWTMFRRRWAGAVLSWAVMTGMVFLLVAEVSPVWMAAAYSAVWCTAVLAVLIRFGLTSALVMWATSDALLKVPAGLQFSSWYQNAGQLVALTVLLLAMYSFHSALAGRRVLSAGLLGE